MSPAAIPAILSNASYTVRSRKKVRLGPLVVDIRSNEDPFVGLSYFPASTHADDNAVADYTLTFCNLNVDGPWPHAEILEQQDRHYRAKRFAAGYYITDHFGAPAYLFTSGTHYWVLAKDLEPILWPYLVKLLLTLYAIDRKILHLKAAAVAIGEAGTLLVGRGGAGKTVLLARLCEHGARFLSNTHALIEGGEIVAVPAAIRVRNDAFFGPMIATRGLRAGLKSGEYVADPLHDLEWHERARAPLKNICLIDFRGPGCFEVREMDPRVLREYMEQFSLALNVYGLKEDVLDYLDGDASEFANSVAVMKSALDAVVSRCRGLHVSCDATVPANLAALWKILAR